MTFKTMRAFALALLSVGLAACVTGRSEIQVASPLAAAAPGGATVAPRSPLNGRTVVIRSVTDERVFEENPRNPATPSLGFGGAAAATADVKARAFGRKRNGYGKAMGDVVLDEGQTIAGLVRDSITAGFLDAGFQVADAGAAASPGAVEVDARIKQLWEFFTPGFWAVSVTINAEVNLDVAGASAPVVLTVNRVDRGMMVTDNGFKTNLEAALVELRAQTRAAASAPSF